MKTTKNRMLMPVLLLMTSSTFSADQRIDGQLLYDISNQNQSLQELSSLAAIFATLKPYLPVMLNIVEASNATDKQRLVDILTSLKDDQASTNTASQEKTIDALIALTAKIEQLQASNPAAMEVLLQLHNDADDIASLISGQVNAGVSANSRQNFKVVMVRPLSEQSAAAIWLSFAGREHQLIQGKPTQTPGGELLLTKIIASAGGYILSIKTPTGTQDLMWP